MALRGTVDGGCPRGCDEDPVPVWSFVRADADEALREALLAGELNLVSCSQCGDLYFPEATVVYFDPAAELLAFVFPESYRGEEARWRAKMGADFAKMRGALGGELGLEAEPALFFGLEECRALLRSEQDLADEVRVAEALAPGLGLGMLHVQRAYARARGLPWKLPTRGPAEGFDLARARAGLEALLAENDRLEGYRRWRAALEGAAQVPVRRRPA